VLQQVDNSIFNTWNTLSDIKAILTAADAHNFIISASLRTRKM